MGCNTHTVRHRSVRSSLLSILLITAGFDANESVAVEDFFSDIHSTTTDAESNTADSRFDSIVYIHQKAKFGLTKPNLKFDHERERSGLAQLRTDIFAESSYELNDQWLLKASAKAEVEYVRWHDGDLDSELNNERLILKDAFIDGRFENGHWLRIGHQVFAWGESESLTISDVLATSDQREFGQAELQDIREQIPAIMYSLPLAAGKLSSVLTYKAGHHRYAGVDEAFNPYITLKGAYVTLDKAEPDNQWEFALKYDVQLNGGDISFVMADINDNDVVFDGFINTTTENTETEEPYIRLSQERLQVASIATNRVLNAWLLKGELGFYHNQAVNSELIQFEHIKTDQVRAMLGFEYSGINNWRLSAEVNGIHQDHAQRTDANGQPGFTLHIHNTALNERLDQHLWLIQLPRDEGTVARWSMTYDWSDHWDFSTDVVLYEANEGRLIYPYEGNDTWNISAKYYF